MWKGVERRGCGRGRGGDCGRCSAESITPHPQLWARGAGQDACWLGRAEPAFRQHLVHSHALPAILTSKYTVTSMLRMSPSCRGRESGMPWQMHSFTDVHTLLGNVPAVQRAGVRDGWMRGPSQMDGGPWAQSEHDQNHSAHHQPAPKMTSSRPLLTVAERRGVRPCGNGGLVHCGIDLICCDPGGHQRARQAQHPRRQVAGRPHPHQALCILDLGPAVPVRSPGPTDIRRPHDVGGNGAWGADGAWGQGRPAL